MTFPPRPSGIKVLIYLDDSRFTCDYSTSILQSVLKTGLVDVEITVLKRVPGDALTKGKLAKYDEIWFFLRSLGRAEPLTTAEIRVLHEWMNEGGGILLTGDHAERVAGPLKGVGGDVGRCVPRARQMRLWEDGPTKNPKDQQDTIDAKVESGAASSIDLERDSVSQRLLLPRIRKGMPYPIFYSSLRRLLDRFPDHRHEGEVTVADLARLTVPNIKNEWPSTDIKPAIIACSVDWRHGRAKGLMAQWDGHDVEVGGGIAYGRILVDASFHHYVDDNLVAIAEVGGDQWVKIQGVFRNQLAWLARKKTKSAWQHWALDWAYAQPCYQDIPKEDSGERAEVANRLVASVLPGAWFHEIPAAAFEGLGHKFDVLVRNIAMDCDQGFDGHLIVAYMDYRAARRAFASPSKRAKSQKSAAYHNKTRTQVQIPTASEVIKTAIASYRKAAQAERDENDAFLNALERLMGGS